VTSGLLAMGILVSIGQNTVMAQQAADPVHAAHVAAGAMPPDVAKGDTALSQQLSQLQAKVAQLEAIIAKSAPPMAAATADAAMPGMPAATPSTTPAMNMGMDKMKSGGGMAGMSGPAAPAGGMMGMMDKMMGMMDKMMSMGGGAMSAGAPMPGSGSGGMGGGGMGMGMMQSEMGGMGGGGAMPAGAPATGMSGGASMGMDKMEMAGMMGKGAMSIGAAGTMSQSALPGFPGASHLYHIGATGFFLDHPQHISLTTDQQAGLNKAKEQAELAKSTADRAVEQAEQELWTLTAADQPDATAIKAKIAEIENLTGDERLAFIRAVGDATKLLTDEQRKTLTGFAPPATAAPAMAPMAAGMKGM